MLFSPQVPSYFELKIELYSHLLSRDLPSSSFLSTTTPQKIARSISKAVGKTILASGGGSKAPWKDFENIGPKFELVASANLTLDDCSEGESDIVSSES